MEQLAWIKKAKSFNTFKHNFKKHYLTWITKRCIYAYVCNLYVYMSVCPWVCAYIHMDIYCVFLWLIHSVFYPFLSFSFWLEGPHWKYNVSAHFVLSQSLFDAIHTCLQWYFNFDFYTLIFSLVFIYFGWHLDFKNLQFFNFYRVSFSFHWWRKTTYLFTTSPASRS